MSLTVSELYSIRDRNADSIYGIELDILYYEKCVRECDKTQISSIDALRYLIRKSKKQLASLVKLQKQVKKSIAKGVEKNRNDDYFSCMIDDITDSMAEEITKHEDGKFIESIETEDDRIAKVVSILNRTKPDVENIIDTNSVGLNYSENQIPMITNVTITSNGTDRSTTIGIGDVSSKEKGSGARYNAGKPDFSLIPLCTLEDEAKVWMIGAKKYSPNNWMKGMPWSAPFSSLMRHLSEWQRGVDLDPETQLPHLAHAQCNLRMLTLYSKNYLEGDDRPTEFLK